MSSASPHDVAAHYDRVTAAWTLLLGDDLHYGVFASGEEHLELATSRLTSLMTEAAALEPGLEILDVGCGTGAPACRLARVLGARVTGITTSAVGVDAARARAAAECIDDRATFELRDGTDNGYPAESFDRVWVLESSHLMRQRERLIAECARVLRPRGRLVLCDIVLARRMEVSEVRRLREPLLLLRDVFGDARMETVATYRRLAEQCGLVIERLTDLTAETRPTFDNWRRNATRHRDELVALLGEVEVERFVEACGVLERFWDDGTLGYALIAAARR